MREERDRTPDPASQQTVRCRGIRGATFVNTIYVADELFAK